MNTLDAIARRKSVRSYKPDPVPEDALEAILRAGMAAPVAMGAYDSLCLTVIQDPELLNEIGNAATEMASQKLGRPVNKNFGAPVMIVVSSRKSMIPGLEYANAAAVLENMAIAATDLGLGSVVWGGAAAVLAQDPRLLGQLGLPEAFAPVLAISLGCADSETPVQEHRIPVNFV